MHFTLCIFTTTNIWVQIIKKFNVIMIQSFITFHHLQKIVLVMSILVEHIVFSPNFLPHQFQIALRTCVRIPYEKYKIVQAINFACLQPLQVCFLLDLKVGVKCQVECKSSALENSLFWVFIPFGIASIPCIIAL